MGRKLRLTDEAWCYGSYPRRGYKRDILYLFYQYKDVAAFFNLNTKRFTLEDAVIEQMVQGGLISASVSTEYETKVQEFLSGIWQYDDAPIEAVYEEIYKIRKSVVGESVLEQLRIRKMDGGFGAFDETLGIDQRRKKNLMIERNDAVLAVLCQPELYGKLDQDLRQAQALGKQIYVLVDPEQGNCLPAKEVMERYLTAVQNVHYVYMDDSCAGLRVDAVRLDESLQELIETGGLCLLVYGEEGLLQCKHLLADSVVYANVSCYYTKAVTNQLDGGFPCVVYVPPHFDIQDYVPLMERTRLSFWQLAQLWERYGDDIYRCSLKELYQRYPQFFVNMYANGKTCHEALEGYPIQVDAGELEEVSDETWLGRYDRLRDEAISRYLNQDENHRYISTYFDEELEEIPVPWGEAGPQSGIMVQGVCLKEVRGSKVLVGSPKLGLHQMVQHGCCGNKEGEPYFYSNFLFFMTPKLGRLYNELRQGRQREQYEFDQNHLDYMLNQRDGRRIETFPLYRKACIAMKKDGRALFFHFQLKGGRLRIENYELAWTQQDVNAWEECQSGRQAPIRLYTPYMTLEDEREDVAFYGKLVGAGRLNLIVIQDQIVCIRMGDVVLSSVGVVVSLEASAGRQLVDDLGLKELGDGYYECRHLRMELELEPPEEMLREEWKQVQWAYGGGMTLIFDGQSIGDDDQMKERLRKEGWMTPLSRQTQESQVHKMAKHPRTAIGVTKEGYLVLLVFSGRTRLSTGADYHEMCKIAKKLFPDIQHMMNVDGGGSAVLGLSIGRSFVELSYPALSTGSTVGMVRPISTMLCVT